MTNDYEKLLEENKKLQDNNNRQPGNNAFGNIPGEIANDEDLKAQLGDKYYELGDMVSALKDNLVRVAQ